jgi:CBS domain-containing protein
MPNDISALLSSPIEHFINTNVAILEGDKFADQALSLMKEKDVRSVLVSHVGEVVGRQVIISSHSAVLGMVSRDDIFEKIHMATVSTAHTAIKGTPVCIINPKSIVYMKDVSTAKLTCPYCESPFDTKEGLSNHIDRFHSGSGVLEGDVRRMFE